MGDLIRDAFGIAIRRPLFVLILPAVIFVAAELLSSYLLYGDPGLEFDWEDSWINLRRVLAMPLLGLCWVAIAREPNERRSNDREGGLRIAGATACATLLGLAFLLLTEWTYVGGVAVVAVFAPLVPIAATESGGVARALARNFALGRGSRGRTLVAWGLIELMLLVVGLGGGLALALGSLDVREEDLVFVLGLRIHAGLRWGLTMALSVAVYRRLRVSRSALDVDAWVEVFE